MFKVSFLTVLLCVAACNASTIKVDFATKTNANVLISFETGSAPALDAVERQSFPSRTAKIIGLKASLENHAAKTQQNVQDFLRSKNIQFRSYWISNQISIKKVDSQLAETLASLFPEISVIYEERIPTLDPVLGKRPESDSIIQKADELTYGLKQIEVEKAWNITNGTGVLVGHIDTGARYTHEAIRENYQNDTHSWFDDEDHRQFPHDVNGHGTHTMGTIAGSKGVGVAPGAQWMTCRPQMIESSFLFCTQWMLAPTKWDGTDADPSKSPRLCSNSWSFNQGEKTFDAVTKAWVAAGIVPVFTSGNWGPSCETTKSPGDLGHVISVGAIDEEKKLAYFSSVGSTVDDGRIKPDITGPGVDVLSSSVDGDDKYEYMSGTSMACPHVAGVAALVISVNPNLTVPEIKDVLLKSTDTDVVSTGEECGGLNDRQFPNHHFGNGRLNAYKAVQAALKTL